LSGLLLEVSDGTPPIGFILHARSRLMPGIKAAGFSKYKYLTGLSSVQTKPWAPLLRRRQARYVPGAWTYRVARATDIKDVLAVPGVPRLSCR